MNDASLQSIWNQRIKDFKQSGLSKSEWCRNENLKLHQLYYWLDKATKNNGQQPEKKQWYKVEDVLSSDVKTDTVHSSKIILEVNGIKINVDLSVNEALLRRVLLLVKSC
ncbi:MAG: IS66 family insertion sequence element accessory protein TnpA [Bacilli bacterium]